MKNTWRIRVSIAVAIACEASALPLELVSLLAFGVLYPGTIFLYAAYR